MREVEPLTLDLEQVEQPGEDVLLAQQFLTGTPSDTPLSLLDIYGRNDAESAVARVEINTDKSSVNILHLSELLIGHQDADVTYFADVIRQVDELPKSMRPDAVVMSGIIQGDFKRLQPQRRATLVPGLDNVDTQFRYARQIIDSVRATGIPIVYNLSNDDRRVAEEANIEVFRRLYALSNSHREEGIPYFRIGQMRQHPEWNTHLQFQTDVVFPYCLRSGRALRTAEQIAEASDGAVEVDEYMLLFDTYKRLARGEPANPAYAALIDTDKLHNSDDLIITDSVDLTLNTMGQSYTDMIRHNLDFSTESMPANHMSTAVAAMGHLAAAGEQLPHALVTQHHEEGVGVLREGDRVVMSTPGFLDPIRSLQRRGRNSTTPGDASRRMLATRRRAVSPGAVAHERTDDGRQLITIFNQALTEKSHSMPERTAIALYCDWQTGSITARPDYQVKFMDYVHSRTLSEGPVGLFVGGDIVHGRNYPDFPSESQSSGLMSMESQIGFAADMISQSLEGLSSEQVAGLVKVIVEPGNHEWNSGTVKWHGDSFTRWLRDIYEGTFTRHGYSRSEVKERVNFSDAAVTPRGEFFKTFTGVGYFGENNETGVTVQHYALDRGAKGNMGGLPIYQAQQHAVGAGEVVKNIDYQLFGHWHHPQWLVHGNKLAVIGGSLAGLSGYEYWRGYRPVIGGTILHIGGGLPPQLEFVTETALNNHTIKDGPYSDANLNSEGFKNDREFDPTAHGIMMPANFPKSALQKALLAMMRRASQSQDTVATFK